MATHDFAPPSRSIDLSYQPFLPRSQLRGESSDFQAAQRAAKTARALREPRRIGWVGVDHEKMAGFMGKNGGFMAKNDGVREVCMRDMVVL